MPENHPLRKKNCRQCTAGAEEVVTGKGPAGGARLRRGRGPHGAGAGQKDRRRRRPDLLQAEHPLDGEGPRGGRREGVAGRERPNGRPRRGHPLRLPHQSRLREGDGPHPFPLRARGRGVARRHARRAVPGDAPRLVRRRPGGGGISRIATAIRSFGKFPKGVTLLLENTAGQGNSIGRTMDSFGTCSMPPGTRRTWRCASTAPTCSSRGTTSGVRRGGTPSSRR